MKKVLLTILGLAFTAFAFWPAGGVKVVETPDVIENPQMVYIEDGSVVISWEADRQIYCQKLDTTGVIHWDAAGVRVCLSDSAQRDHHMVTDGQDVWFVWQDERNDDGDIYAQKISGSTGQRLWGDQGKAVCVKAGTQLCPKGVVLSGAEFSISWSDYSTNPKGIGAQWLTVQGQVKWDASGIPVTRGGVEGYNPAVIPSGNAILDVWEAVEPGAPTPSYLAQRIDSNGTFQWDTLGLTVEYVYSGFGGICTDNKGGAIILFNNYDRLAVQHIDSLGQVLWDSGGVKVLDFNSAMQSLPQELTEGLVSDNMGGGYVWQALPVSFGSARMQHIDSSGALKWDNRGIIYWHKRWEEAPAGPTKLCPDGNYGVMAIFDNLGWESPDPPPPNLLGLYAQRINSSDQVVFDSNGVAICLDTSNYYEGTKAAVAVPVGVIAVWLDKRNNPNVSLYAQIVDTTGKVGSGITEEKTPAVLKPVLDITSIVNTGTITLRYSLPVGESGTLKLFDASGSLIRLQEVTQPEGVITWVAASIPSGVYFAHLATTNNARVSRKVVVLN